MPSTFSRNLGLELISTGEQAGVWGSTTNENLGYVDDAIDGITQIALAGSSYTLTTIDGGDCTGRKKVLEFVGAITADCTIQIQPSDAQKHYFVVNNTSARLRFQQGAGNVFSLDASYANIIWCDGGGVTGDAANASVFGILDNLQVSKLKVGTGGITNAGPITHAGTATFSGAVTFNGAATFAQPVTMGSTCAIAGTLNVTGLATLASANITSLGAGVSIFAGVASFLAGVNCTAGIACATPATISGAGNVTINCATFSVTGGTSLNGGVGITGSLVVVGSVQFAIGSDATGDLYYRAASGFLARVPIGAAGTFLRTTVGGIPGFEAVNFTIGIGTAVASSTQGRVLYTWGGVLAQSSGLYFDQSAGLLGVGLSGTPGYHFHLYNGGSETNMCLDGAANMSRRIRFASAGSAWWDFASGTPGMGIYRYTDGGATPDTLPFFIYRSNSHVCIGTNFDNGAALSVTAIGVNTLEPAAVFQAKQAPGDRVTQRVVSFRRSDNVEVAGVRGDGVMIGAAFSIVTPPALFGGEVTYQSIEDHIVERIEQSPELRARVQALLQS